MSVEHPICPYCEEPLDRMVENGVAGLRACSNSKCPGKRSDIEDLESDQDNPAATARRAQKTA